MRTLWGLGFDSPQLHLKINTREDQTMDRCGRTRVYANPDGGRDIAAVCTLRARHGWNHEDEIQGLSWDRHGYLEVQEALRSHVRNPEFRNAVLSVIPVDGPGTAPEAILAAVSADWPDAVLEDVTAALSVWGLTHRRVRWFGVKGHGADGPRVYIREY